MESSESPHHSPIPQHHSSDSPSCSAAKFLSNLPSRGLLSSTIVSSNLSGLRPYVCDHDTAPPEGQHIKTNQTNILIRSLQIIAENSKDTTNASSSDGSKKRPSNYSIDGKASAKRSNTQQAQKLDGTEVCESSSSPSKNFHTLTVEKLRALLKEKGLSTKGKKDELVARLRSVNE